MKKSELRQIIKEEIYKLNEADRYFKNKNIGVQAAKMAGISKDVSEIRIRKSEDSLYFYLIPKQFYGNAWLNVYYENGKYVGEANALAVPGEKRTKWKFKIDSTVDALADLLKQLYLKGSLELKTSGTKSPYNWIPNNKLISDTGRFLYRIDKKTGKKIPVNR